MTTQHSEVNPYLNARREWDSQFGGCVKDKQSWQRIAFAAMLIAAVAVSGAVYIGSQSKIVPYLVEVDKVGNIQVFKYAEKMKPADPRVIIAQLTQFVESLRSVYVDATAQRKAIDYVYSQLNQGSPATAVINEYYKTHSPFERAKTGTVTVDQINVLPVTPGTWQIEWLEIERDRNGKQINARPVRMKAMATIEIRPPEKVNQRFINNPIGLAHQQFSWSRQI